MDGINQDLEILYKRIDFNLFDVYDSAPDGDVSLQAQGQQGENYPGHLRRAAKGVMYGQVLS